jgi:hypothetical protein
MDLHEKGMLAVTTAATNVNFICWHWLFQQSLKVFHFLSDPGHWLACPSDVPSYVRGNIGVDVVCQIEKHFGLPTVAYDIHDAFKVVALGLPFEDSFPQNFMRWRWDLDFFNKGVVPIQRYGQYQVQAGDMLVLPKEKYNTQFNRSEVVEFSNGRSKWSSESSGSSDRPEICERCVLEWLAMSKSRCL